MEVCQKNCYYLSPVSHPLSIEDAVVKHLEEKGDGHIERLEDGLTRVRDFVGQLVQKLHELGKLDDDDVLELLPYWEKYNDGAPSDT